MHTVKKLALMFLVLSALPVLLAFLSNRLAPAFHARMREAMGEEWELSLEFWRDGQTMVALLFVIVLVSLMILIRKKGFIGRSRFRLPRGKEIVAAVLVGLATVFILQGVLQLFREAFPAIADSFQTRFSRIAEEELLPIVLAVLLVSPFFEEILFRGILFRVFEKERVSLWVLLVLTSLLFALYRIDLFEGIYAFFLGLAIGLAYIRSQSIWIPIIIHYVHNIGASWFERTPLPDDTAPIIIGSASVVLVLSLLSIHARRRR